MVIVSVAGVAVWAREGAFNALSVGWLARALPLVEVAAGVAVAAISVEMLRHAV